VEREVIVGCADQLDTIMGDLFAAAIAYEHLVGRDTDQPMRRAAVHLQRMAVSHSVLALYKLIELEKLMRTRAGSASKGARSQLAPVLEQLKQRGIPAFRNMVVAHARYGGSGITPATMTEASKHLRAACAGGDVASFFVWTWGESTKGKASPESVSAQVANARDVLRSSFGITYLHVVNRADPRT